MSHYDQWKTAAPPDSPEYDYDRYKGLPYRFDESLGRYRDAETGQIVPEYLAVEKNDAECKKQETARIDRENAFFMEET